MADGMTATWFWLGLFGLSALVFFSIAVWVIIRGGKDVLEILSESRRNIGRNGGGT